MYKKIEKFQDSDLLVLTPNVFDDERGYFFESFNDKGFNLCFDQDKIPNFIQDNESCSQKNVIRGLHYQNGLSAQAKLVRVIKGAVIDFVLDIRKESKTFGKVFWIKLSDKNKLQFYIPRGFAHGFISLKNNTIFSYKCDNYYDKMSERGINVLDPDLDILNKIGVKSTDNLIFSEKDKLYPAFKEVIDFF